MSIRTFILILLPFGVFSQNTIGFPEVTNYYKSNYRAGTQNWDIRQDSQGIIYCANNEGLLSFDGRYWNIYPLPNKTIVRSVEINKDGRIYAGGQDELGFFTPDSKGCLSYTSLVTIIPEKDRAFGDVWDIVIFQSSVFFRTTNRIFKYSGRAMEIFRANTDWTFLGAANGRLFAQDSRSGLMEFFNNTWMPTPISSELPGWDPVTSVLALRGNSLYCTTLKNGLYKLSAKGLEKIINPQLQQIEQQRIYAATRLNNNWIALGTTLGGLYIIDEAGNVIQHFSKEEGLQNNNILCLFLDKHNNLWLGLDNGIDFIPYNSAIKHIRVNRQGGSGYAALIHKDFFYLGTSSGLFYMPLPNNEDISFSKGDFLPVSNSTGQNWNLANINNQLLLGHHDGAFAVEGNKARQIAAGTGYWNFRPASNVSPTQQFIAGNYKGISIFDCSGDDFRLSEEVNDFPESSRYLETDLYGNYWVSHPYHGVYQVSKESGKIFRYRLYTEKNGLPNMLNNHVFKIKNEIVVATEKGIFTYNNSKDRFEPSSYYLKILGPKSLRYLKEDTEGNIWFVHEKNLGLIDYSGREPKVNYITELDNKILSGFEMIYPVNSKNILIAGEDGFYHVNYEKYAINQDQPIVNLREVRIFNPGDSLLFGGYYAPGQDKAQSYDPQIAHPWKNIMFKFTSASFGQHSRPEYSYRLKGYEDNWSEWTEKNEKEYTNLPAGNYIFLIRSRNKPGQESETVSYSFTILAPWYLSAWAYLVYFIFFLTLIYFLVKRQRKKFINQTKFHEEEQKKLQSIHEYEISKAESELMALRNEKLQSDIDFKNSELATTAMHLVQKGELIARIKNDLTHIMKDLDNEKAIAEIRKMLKMLSHDENMDKDWEHFTQHFDKVHSDFVLALKEVHSNLSANETKLCTYLRMNLSSKEIAQLMNISVRGVEISRYRLRKKLGISTEISLFDYLISLGGKVSTSKQLS